MFSSGSSSLKVTQISKTDRAKFISIRTIDFETDRFDGDPRDAILWVEHFEDYFGTKGLAYLFDPLHPALLRPDHLYALKAFDLQEETYIIQEFKNSTFVFKPGSQQQKLLLFNLLLESLTQCLKVLQNFKLNSMVYSLLKPIFKGYCLLQKPYHQIILWTRDFPLWNSLSFPITAYQFSGRLIG